MNFFLESIDSVRLGRGGGRGMVLPPRMAPKVDDKIKLFEMSYFNFLRLTICKLPSVKKKSEQLYSYCCRLLQAGTVHCVKYCSLVSTTYSHHRCTYFDINTFFFTYIRLTSHAYFRNECQLLCITTSHCTDSTCLQFASTSAS